MPDLTSSQFKYLQTDNPNENTMQVKAFHPETGAEVGSLSVQVRQQRRGARGLEPKPEPQIKGLHVHPDYQRRGVATELHDIAAHHVGGPLMHDTSVTPEANAWASKVGGPRHEREQIGMSYTDQESRDQFAKHRTTTASQFENEEGWTSPQPRQLRMAL